jgi:hypothetical protein
MAPEKAFIGGRKKPINSNLLDERSNAVAKKFFGPRKVFRGVISFGAGTQPATPIGTAFNAKMFTPHPFQTQRYILNPSFHNPEVEITPEAFLDMYNITGYAGYNEVGWLGTVTRKEDVLRIEEIFLFKQEVAGSSTELNSEHIAEVATKLIREGAMDKVNALKFWGHAHPGNSTSPSPQDDDTMAILEDGNAWFLRGIFGRNGRAEFTLYDYLGKVKFEDIPWKLVLPESEARKAIIKEQIGSLLEPAFYQPYAHVPELEEEIQEEALDNLPKEEAGPEKDSGNYGGV